MAERVTGACYYDADDEFDAEIEEDEPLLKSSPNTSINVYPSGSSDFLLSALRIRDHQHMSKKRIIKNLFFLLMSLFIYFMGFQSLSNLQSTMNSKSGIGMKSQAIVYGASMISSLFLPDLLMKTVGCKRTLVVMMCCSIPWFASNYNPTSYITMPFSILMGLAIGPMNTGMAIYINEMAGRYLRVSKTEESLESILARFYGLLSFSMENTQIWGNLGSYYILRPGMAPILNHTRQDCGIDFNPYGNATNPNLEPPTDEQRYVLVSAFTLAAVVAATLMGLYMDKLENDIQPVDCGEGEGRLWYVIERLMNALKQSVVPHQILLVPLTVFLGIELTFYTTEFTAAYIACSWGVHHVGFVTICFGVCGALMSLLVGPLVKCISQMAVLILAASANIAMCVVLFLWDPDPETPYVYFVIAGVWGMGDAIWWSQVTALYGLMFPNDREAAFSNLYFWSFLGFFISYLYANYFTVAVKIEILLCFLITGMLGYLIGQFKLKCSSRREYVAIPVEDEQ